MFSFLGGGSSDQENLLKAPVQQGMQLLDRHETLIVKQTARGCLQECMGCEAKSEFKIAPYTWGDVQVGYPWRVSESAMNTPDLMYALEESSFISRCCWRDGRSFNMKVSSGGEPGGTPIVNYDKPCGMPLYCSIPTQDGSIDVPCCCMLPTVSTTLPDGSPLGSESKYICDQFCFVPKLSYSEGGKDIYIVRPQTCCGGCCIACKCCSGKGAAYISFYFHDANTGKVVTQDPTDDGFNDNSPQIKKVWGGFKKECCTTADTFIIKFPQGCDANRKAGLLGMTFLIDFTVFERQQQSDV
mmetsp:Transcript_31293/g.66598  ORF Transcript_31293/g.66598 Transcript_31293/m.66598 type:complete len:299 (-) Transcript_31293:114-1010(-)